LDKLNIAVLISSISQLTLGDEAYDRLGCTYCALVIYEVCVANNKKNTTTSSSSHDQVCSLQT